MLPASNGAAAPTPESHDVDAYACHKVRRTNTTAATAGDTIVTVEDAFTHPAKRIRVLRLLRLCLPVALGSQGTKNPASSLLCYRTKPIRGQSGHDRVDDVLVTDQLGGARLATSSERELCVPSSASLAAD
jgi:hypothetical protein